MRFQLFPGTFALFDVSWCINFGYEAIQLTERDIDNFPAIAFGDTSDPIHFPACKAFPGTHEWPLENEWSQLNSSLGGALLKPVPLASVCYAGPLYNAEKCRTLQNNPGRIYTNDPLTVLTEWPEGDTCPATSTPNVGSCTQGGFPVYVINATTVKQIQIGVNFARNKNIRLVIKNTGHEWTGRSSGAGSLSIWTHYLKSFEYLPQYSQDEYKGRAARVGAGLETWEMFNYMASNRMGVVVPAGTTTIGPYGGWMAGGGHSILTSSYGMGSDQPLSLQVVTADGRFVTADPITNEDLFFAMRGGGGSTYGIVTSAIVKAYPPITVTRSSLQFTSSNVSLQKFWEGINLYFFWGKLVTENGGTAFSNVIRNSATSFSFNTNVEMPNKSLQEVFDFVQPFVNSIKRLGISMDNPTPTNPSASFQTGTGQGDRPGNQRFGSRLFPRRNWEDETLWNQTMDAIQESVEAGYTFHGIHLSATEELAGYPGNNAVNPGFRNGLMHADSFDSFSIRGKNEQQVTEAHARQEIYMEKIRAVTPDGGAYLNEADVEEPNWQQSFFGSNYPRLLEIKGKRDPWGVFWASTTPGSEKWEVRESDPVPSQNGPLCRVI
ncbi:hypothetical protein HYFRA_00001878 [Hymenoscyphus fraxineus]|uniref:FAD-binding PCMH-type domain-containing protein n=1 Tax=Hymenoscyphus fraxineus TaxID=746836 RepID=A0A9N9PNU9_9HELO|nr:hypothetical protein HYFRA_00001878 [Hymenoscyphus fraxineus]